MPRSAAEKAEILKCGQDPIYFIRKYVKIQHTTRGLIPFNLFPYQEGIINSLEHHRKTIVLKSRQLGLTETVSHYVFWLCLFHRDKIVIVFSKDKGAAGEFIRRIRIAYDNLPKFLKIATLPRDNVFSIGFSNRSMIECFGRTDDAGVGRSASLIVMDEAALIRHVDELWAAVKPTISTSGGKVIIMSTPRGFNWFQEMCANAKKEKEMGDKTGVVPDWQYHELPWHSWPGHDEEWFKNETKDMPAMKIAQEYMCDFVGSGETLLDTPTLGAIKESIMRPTHTSMDNKIYWWGEVDGDKEYVVAVDPSRGDSADFGAIQVLDKETGEQIAEYYERVSPDILGNVALQIAKQCNDAHIIVDDTGGYGLVILKILEANMYPNVYYWEKGSANAWRRFDIFSRKQADMGKNNSRYVAGWRWTQKNRPVVVNNMEVAMRNKKITIHGMRTYEEFLRFKWQDGKAQAEHGAHDDLVMSLALAIWCVHKVADTDSARMAVTRAMSTMITGTSENTQMRQNIDSVKRGLMTPFAVTNTYMSGDPQYLKSMSGLLK